MDIKYTHLNISSKGFHGSPLIFNQCFDSSSFDNQWQNYHLHKLETEAQIKIINKLFNHMQQTHH